MLFNFKGQNQGGLGRNGPGDGKKDDKGKEKKKYERPLPTRVGKRKKKSKGPDAANKLPSGIYVYLYNILKILYLKTIKIHICIYVWL